MRRMGRASTTVASSSAESCIATVAPALAMICESDVDVPAFVDNPTGRAMAFAKKMRTGQVSVNGGQFNISAPFGGYKKSGNGRELGVHGFEEFLEIKSIQKPIE